MTFYTILRSLKSLYFVIPSNSNQSKCARSNNGSTSILMRPNFGTCGSSEEQKIPSILLFRCLHFLDQDSFRKNVLFP